MRGISPWRIRARSSPRSARGSSTGRIEAAPHRSLVIAGATIWGASILEAAFSEQRLAARLKRVRDYSTTRRVSVSPYAGSDRVGLAVTFF